MKNLHHKHPSFNVLNQLGLCQTNQHQLLEPPLVVLYMTYIKVRCKTTAQTTYHTTNSDQIIQEPPKSSRSPNLNHPKISTRTSLLSSDHREIEEKQKTKENKHNRSKLRIQTNNNPNFRILGINTRK